MSAPAPVQRLAQIADALGDYVRHVAASSGGRSLVDLALGVGDDDQASATQLCSSLERLGPVYIKLGQLLSTRPDLVSPAYMTALSRLQSQVEPLSREQVRASVEAHRKALGREVFAAFDEAPLAAASLAQVHRATLLDGTVVAVKLRRPGVAALVSLDLRLLGLLAELAQRALPDAEVYDLPGTVEELSNALREELDLRREAENLETFSQNLVRWSAHLHVPTAHPELTTEEVLVMQLVEGSKLTDRALDHVDPGRRRELAHTLAKAYFQMFFVDGIFHADPHPGNVLVRPDGGLSLLDFGMVGRIERQLSDALVRVLLAFRLRDAHGVAHAFLDIGKPTSRADEGGWVMDVRRLLPRYHGVRLDRLNLGTMLIELLRTAAKNGIQAPPVVALVCKSLANMDGTARLIDPGIDVTVCFQELLPDIVSEHASRLASLEEAAKVLLDVQMAGQRVPRQLASILEKAATGRLRVVVDPLGLEGAAGQLGRAGTRIALANVIGAALVARALSRR